MAPSRISETKVSPLVKLPSEIFKKTNYLSYSHPQLVTLIFLNPFLLKLLMHTFNPLVNSREGSLNTSHLPKLQYSWGLITSFTSMIFFIFDKVQQRILNKGLDLIKVTSHSNLLPHKVFSSTISKYISSLHLNSKIREDFVPLYFHTLVRFIEAATGKRFILQFYPFLHQNIPLMILIRYKQ